MQAGTLLSIVTACSLTDLEEYRGGTPDAAIDAGGTGGSVAGSAGWPAGGSSGTGGTASDATTSDAVSAGGSGGAPPPDASCSAGLADCDGVAANGCETQLGTNENCSACDDACSAPIGTTACLGGACKVTACPTHRGDCDGLAGNGCEADLTTTDTCGGCSKKCPEAFQCAHNTNTDEYLCACGTDSACLNGGSCYIGVVCVCNGTACSIGQRCTLIGTCF